jgi:hypothetical protein
VAGMRRTWNNERQQWTISLSSLDTLIQTVVACTLDAPGDLSRQQIADRILLEVLRSQ